MSERPSSAQQLKQHIFQSNNKCICQICTCGKHRCPHPHIAFKAQTTNQHDYKPYQVNHSQVKKCGYQLTSSHYDSDLLQSTYRVNYKPHLCPAAQIHKKYAYQPNTAKFHDDTEYKSKYVPNKIVIEGPTPCQNQYRPSTGRFEAKSTYQEQFKEKKKEVNQPKKHYAYHPNNLPFYGDTTYGQNFKGYQVTHEPTVNCNGKYTVNPARFEAKSSYKEFFKPYPIKQQHRCLIEQLPQRPRECSPGKNHVHFDAQGCTWK